MTKSHENFSQPYREKPKEAVHKNKESGINVFLGEERSKQFFEEEHKLRFEMMKRREGLLPREHEKSPAAKELIDFLAKAVPEFAKGYGAQPIKIEEGNILLIPSDIFDLAGGRSGHHKEGVTEAEYDSLFQEIRIRYDGPKDYWLMAKTIAHEILHFQSFQSVEVKYDIYDTRHYRRSGLMARSRPQWYFCALNEAIIEELTQRFFEKVGREKTGPADLQKYLKYRELAVADFEKLSATELEATKKAAPEKFKEFISKHTVHYLEFMATGTEPQKPAMKLVGLVYPHARSRLSKIIDKVYEKNQADFKNKEAVFNLFARGAMSGRLLPLARLIEKTFGKGAFRELGEEISG